MGFLQQHWLMVFEGRSVRDGLRWSVLYEALTIARENDLWRRWHNQWKATFVNVRAGGLWTKTEGFRG